MIQHQLKYIFRSLLADKTTFLINLVGLSVGLAGALLIYCWGYNELQVDRFHDQGSRLHQMIVHYQGQQEIGTGFSTPAQLAETMEAEIPEVRQSIAVRAIDDATLSQGDIHLKANGNHASARFFQAFAFDLIAGKADQILTDQQSIAISDRLALKLFNTTENLVGEKVTFQQDQIFQITGVFEAPNERSTLQFDFVLPFETFKAQNQWALNWDYSTVDTYVKLQEDASLGAFNEKIAGLLDGKRSPGLPTILEATPFGDLYLYGNYENGKVTGGRIEYVQLFSVIAVFILLIVCFNFMNLSTAKATKRLKEIGVKKVIGIKRVTLMGQFLGESMVLVCMALMIAGVIAWWILPTFSQLAGYELVLPLNIQLGATIMLVAIGTGLLAGSYPAIFLSGYKPSHTLKSFLHKHSSERWVRKGLVVFQFAISIMLIIAVMVIHRQIDYVQTQSLGFQKENVLQFVIEGKAKESLATFLSEVRQIPGVKQAASIGQSIVGGANRFTIEKWPGEPDNQVSFEMRTVNFGTLETLGIPLLDGRSFSQEFSQEETKVIFNEAAIDYMGLNDPIGQKVMLEGQELEIIGVTKNFHFASLREAITPLFFVFRPDWNFQVLTRLEAGREKEAIVGLNELYGQFNPGFALAHEFLDQNYQAQYISEERVARLSKYFAILAVLLSCLGLFGLAMFNAETRVKEIGIRKVLGASVAQLVHLLSKDFLVLVVVGFIIAAPLAYFVMNRWLGNFAYHIDLNWWIFALAGISAIGIALLTISYQSMRAAMADPVKSIRSE